MGEHDKRKLSPPRLKGCDSSSCTAEEWLGKLLRLLLLHERQTVNGNNAGRDGVADPDTAQVAAEGSGSDKSKATTPFEELGDKLPPHFSQWYSIVAKLLERATDPVVFAVQRRIIQSEEILYSQLHRHLHHAVFADGDVIMLERMPRTALRGRFEASDMIGLLCWLAQDAVEKLKLGVFLPDNVHGLAEDFADRHLHHDASLFCGDTQATRDDLRGTFEELRRYHPPVDADTEDIIEVIENYLYAGKKIDPSLKIATQKKGGKSGAQFIDNVLFGSQFFDVWEMLCLYHAYKNDIGKNGWKVLIADGGNLPEWLREETAFKNTLVDAVIGKPEKSKYQGGLGAAFDPGRPDLILYNEDENTVSYRVIDFKYYKCEDLRDQPDLDNLHESEKKFFLGVVKDDISKSDIAKSWGYARSVSYGLNENRRDKKLSIVVEFWLPSDTEVLPKKPYFAGELHPKPITSMIDELLKESPNPWPEY